VKAYCFQLLGLPADMVESCIHANTTESKLHRLLMQHPCGFDVCIGPTTHGM
jgi:hypothetical protein